MLSVRRRDSVIYRESRETETQGSCQNGASNKQRFGRPIKILNELVAFTGLVWILQIHWGHKTMNTPIIMLHKTKDSFMWPLFILYGSKLNFVGGV